LYFVSGSCIAFSGDLFFFFLYTQQSKTKGPKEYLTNNNNKKALNKTSGPTTTPCRQEIATSPLRWSLPNK
jgi:hypothetical protein